MPCVHGSCTGYVRLRARVEHTSFCAPAALPATMPAQPCDCPMSYVSLQLSLSFCHTQVILCRGLRDAQRGGGRDGLSQVSGVAYGVQRTSSYCLVHLDRVGTFLGLPAPLVYACGLVRHTAPMRRRLQEHTGREGRQLRGRRHLIRGLPLRARLTG